MFDTELSEMEARCSKAFPPPWNYVQGYGFNFHPSQDGPPTHSTEFVCKARVDVPKLLAEVRRLRKELQAAKAAEEKTVAVISVARKWKAARDERHARTKKLQELAAEARRTGRPGKVPEEPLVWDIGDITEEICTALDELDKFTSRKA